MQIISQDILKNDPRYSPKNGNRLCCVDGCNKLGQHMGKTRADGSVVRRGKCAKHHSLDYGMKGWDYKIFRKDYCENVDGRLGFKCTTNIIDPEWQLDADHINGDPTSHQKLGADAIQTLCKCCHAIKTRDSRDYESAGRKTLGVTH